MTPYLVNLAFEGYQEVKGGKPTRDREGNKIEYASNGNRKGRGASEFLTMMGQQKIDGVGENERALET